MRQSNGCSYDQPGSGGISDKLRRRHGPLPVAAGPEHHPGSGGADGAVANPVDHGQQRTPDEHRDDDRPGCHRCYRPEHSGGLHGTDLHWPGRLHDGRGIHGGHPFQPLRHAVLVRDHCRGLHHCPGRSPVRHPFAADQGPVPGHSHPGGAAHYRVDHQPRSMDQRRRPILHLCGKPGAVRLRIQHRIPALLSGSGGIPVGLFRGPEPGALPYRPGFHRHPGS